VLRSAVDFIADHGPDGLSLRQVAASAGVSHQAPYHHFTDRRGIFKAIAYEGFATFAAALRDAEVRTDLDPAVALLEAYVDFALQHRGHFRVMFRSDLCGVDEDPELAAVAAESFDVLIAHVERSLGPRASVDAVRDRATAMWAIAHGLATLLIDGPLESKVGPVADRHALVRAVAAETGMTGTRRRSAHRAGDRPA